MTLTQIREADTLQSLLDVLAHNAAAADQTGRTDPGSLNALRASGVLNASLPRELGGQGRSREYLRHLLERIGRADASIAIIYFQHLLVIDNLLRWGNAAQKAQFLPGLANGELLAAAAWSESGADRPTVARGRADGRFVIDGIKTYTTGAGLADLYLIPAEVFAADAAEGAPGAPTFFLLGREHITIPNDGFSLSGMRGSSTGWIELKGAVADESDVFGTIGGAGAIKGNLWQSGQSLGSVALGIARAAVDLLRDHIRDRDLGASSAARVKLTELDTQATAIQGFVTLAAREDNDPAAQPFIVNEAKIFASETAERICREVQQQLGSRAYTRGAEIERLWRDARGIALMGPANHLLADMLGGQLLAAR